jgi:hypothetical protein
MARKGNEGFFRVIDDSFVPHGIGRFVLSFNSSSLFFLSLSKIPLIEKGQ